MKITAGMAERLGCYSALAARHLGDDSYALRFLGRVHEITEEQYWTACAEIQRRLLEGKYIGPDEDPFEWRFKCRD